MRHLHDMQLREQNLRSLRYEPRDSFHQPDAPVVAKFEASFNGEEHARRLSTTAWLRIAVWWLLKVSTPFYCFKRLTQSSRYSDSYLIYPAGKTMFCQ
jgi:hypothetical protein